jgi:hypothetical protein
MTDRLVFVNYQSTASDIKGNRRIVATHIGKYHRNRSKPARLLADGIKSEIIVNRQRKRIAPKVSPSLELNDNEAKSSEGVEEQEQAATSTTSLRPLYNLPRIIVPPQIECHRLDPFHTGTVHLTVEMEPVFMYYLSTIMPVVEPAPTERTEYQQWLVPLAMPDSALMYALLRCMALDIEQASVTNLGISTRKSIYPDRFQYKPQATRALNESLADPIQAAKPSTMMAVHFWLWQEVCVCHLC